MSDLWDVRLLTADGCAITNNKVCLLGRSVVQRVEFFPVSCDCYFQDRGVDRYCLHLETPPPEGWAYWAVRHLHSTGFPLTLHFGIAFRSSGCHCYSLR
jgi:hypothetical protein